MNILVTGGNGYIGSRLVDRLLQERYKPTVIDHQDPQGPDRVRSSLRVFKMEAADPKCERLFSDTNYDVVIHLACETLPMHHEESYNQILHANLDALGNILYLSKKFSVPKVVVLFDYRIYGWHQESIKSEDTACQPDSDIGYQEEIREKYCEAYRKQGLQVVSLRTGMIYGSTQTAAPDSTTLRQFLVPYDKDASQSIPEIEEQLIDFLFINDLIEAIIRVCENQTSPILNISSGYGTTLAEFRSTSRQLWHEYETGSVENTAPTIPSSDIEPDFLDSDQQEPAPDSGYYLDNARAAFELAWMPRYSLHEGIQKTIQYFVRREDRIYDIRHADLRSRAGFGGLSTLANPDLENLVFFMITASAAYWLNYRMGINLDLMLIYLILINAFFGLRTGAVAIALAIFIRLWFSFGIENLRLVDFFNDVNQIMYMASYFIIGAGVGVTSDSRKQEKAVLKEQLERSKADLKYTSELYQSSLEVKKSLQEIITNTEDSFSKVRHIFSRLDQTEPEVLFETAAGIATEILKTPQVMIYQIDQTGEYLRLAAATCPVAYRKSMAISPDDVWKFVIRQQKIWINRDLLPDYPMIVAPISNEQRPIAVMLLDGLDFIHMTQHYLNTIKSLSQLIAYYQNRARTIDQAFSGEKYYNHTGIIRQGWFDRVIAAKRASRSPEQLQTVLFKFIHDVHKYQAFYQRVSRQVRSTDHIGELGKGQMGILMSNIEMKDVPGIQARFLAQGFRAEWVSIQ